MPEEAAGDDTPGYTPAEKADPEPVWDRLGSRWTWRAEDAGYLPEDEDYIGPVCRSPGAIPLDRQPYYAHPPTQMERALAEETPDEELL